VNTLLFLAVVLPVIFLLRSAIIPS